MTDMILGLTTIAILVLAYYLAKYVKMYRFEKKVLEKTGIELLGEKQKINILVKDVCDNKDHIYKLESDYNDLDSTYNDLLKVKNLLLEQVKDLNHDINSQSKTINRLQDQNIFIKNDMSDTEKRYINLLELTSKIINKLKQGKFELNDNTYSITYFDNGVRQTRAVAIDKISDDLHSILKDNLSESEMKNIYTISLMADKSDINLSELDQTMESFSGEFLSALSPDIAVFQQKCTKDK